MKKNIDIVDEVTADQIRKRNARHQKEETKRKLAARRGIEACQEELALRNELEDGIGIDYRKVKTCLNCGKSYWKRNKK